MKLRNRLVFKCRMAGSSNTPAKPFRRELPVHVTVAVDGVYRDLVPDEPVKDTRPVGRVVLVMPDFYADSFAHSLAALCRVVDTVGGDGEFAGPTERAIAEALFEAAQSTGYKCPEGGLKLLPSQSSEY
jgi:hypothetical protein